jgi:hypothetical protein
MRVRGALLGLCLAPFVCQGGTLAMKNAFIEKFKNRATVDATFRVDHVLSKPHAIAKGGDDGDLHMAGTAPEVGLAVVAEIVNAGAPLQALVATRAEGDGGKTVKISGVWRLWFEHPPANGVIQKQGDPVAVAPDSNPDHVFEIHPVSAFDGTVILKSFDQIPKYTAYDAKTAFGEYEALTATVTANATATIIDSPRAGHNYTEFKVVLGGPPVASDDGGLLVLGTVFQDDETPVTSGPRRMVFVGGTSAAVAVKKGVAGSEFHLLGIPRVNLERISFATKKNPGKTFTMPLPYEMIIVAVLP